MIWALTAAVSFFASLLAGAWLIPPELYGEIFSHARWGGSLGTAIAGLVVTLLFTHLQHLVAEDVKLGWREKARRVSVVHALRIRLAGIVTVVIVCLVLMLALPVVGPASPEALLPYWAAFPPAAGVLILFFVVSMLRWLVGVSSAQRRLCEKAEKQKDKEAFLGRLRQTNDSPLPDDKQRVIDGRMH
jgi:hypothetical protein